MAKAATRAEFPFIIWKENLKEASSEQLFSPVSRSSRLPNPPRKTKGLPSRSHPLQGRTVVVTACT